MFTVKRTQEFDDWLDGLPDSMTQRRLQTRLRKVQLGNLGDVESVCNGICEMREHFGAGWRMYYVQRESVIIVMLGGGNKASQKKDIALAKTIADNLED